MRAAPRLRPGHALVLVFIAIPCSAQPRVTNGRLVERPAAGTLATAVRELTGAAGPAWVAWEAPLVAGRELTCCCTGDSGAGSRDERTAARLEPPNTFFVFVRAEGGRPERVRMFGADCELDAGGLTVTWLTGVTPAESVSFLADLASGPAAARRVVTGALAAVAQHGNPEATPLLLRLARNAPDAKLRGQALFWVAQRAGQGAGAAITDAIANDPETEVKKRAVFALSQLPAAEGVPLLIGVARTNRNPAVRKQAMFWLGQSKDPRALDFFEEILK